MCVCVCVVSPVAVWIMAFCASPERGADSRWEEKGQWHRVHGMRHSSGWVSWCDEDEHEGNGNSSEEPQQRELADAWLEGFGTGLFLGVATAMAGVAWLKFG